MSIETYVDCPNKCKGDWCEEFDCTPNGDGLNAIDVEVEYGYGRREAIEIESVRYNKIDITKRVSAEMIEMLKVDIEEQERQDLEPPDEYEMYGLNRRDYA